MKFTNYLFDLDGTLTDPGPGIRNSLKYAFEKFGIPIPPDKELNSFIGPPLLDSFQTYCRVPEDDSKTLLRYYREYFSKKGLYENGVYPEIRELLRALCQSGCSLYVATSKPEPYAKKILEHFDLLRFFNFVGGSTIDESRTKKDEVIRYVIKENRLIPSTCLMIGDRCYDIEGAHSCGIQAAAVLYGYGSEVELSAADYLIKTPAGLTLI